MYNHGSERKKRNETEHNEKCKADVHGLRLFGEVLNIPRSIVKCIQAYDPLNETAKRQACKNQAC